MQLHFHPASHNARRALVVAREVKADVEIVLVDILNGAQRTPEYLALNPNGLVPTLVDGDTVLWESTAIAHYLAEKAGSPLLGSGPAGRADVIRWEAWALAHLARATDVFLFENLVKKLFGLGAPDLAAVASATASFHKHAAVLDAHLVGKTWVAGNALSLADISLAAIFSGADLTGVPWSAYSEIHRWYDGVTELPSWKAANVS